MAKDISPLIKEFEEFFENVYAEKVEKFVSAYPNTKGLEVDYKDLEKFSTEMADMLVESPDVVIEAAEEALSSKQPSLPPEMTFEPHVRFFGLPKEHQPLIQDIGADQVGRMICVDGLITRRTEIRPKVKMMFLRCGLCDNVEKIPVDKDTIIPDTCSACKRRALKAVSEESKFVNLQKAEAQEPLEKLRGGAPTSRLELWLEDDLVNMITPGQRVEITGILRIRPYREAKGTYSQTVFSTFLDVNHLKRVEMEFEEVDITKADEERIIALSKDPEIYSKVIKSIAPSIYGYDEVKEALALQLFSGTQGKELSDGGKIRSDIHVLLIGDPGISKTRMLQYIANLAPKSIYVSGKAVSGVGLTASAEKDSLGDGGWTLKAGALVLASGGCAALDEFDKVKEDEMAALHEAMESQSYHPKTKIMLSNGDEMEMGEFVENLLHANPERVIEGKDCFILKMNGEHKVLTTDFDSIYETDVTQVSKHKAPAHFIRVKLQSGRELLVTPEHPFWVLEDCELKTVDAQSLRAGNFIPMPERIPVAEHEEEYGADFYRFLGYHITDGCYELNRGVKNGISFSNKNMELVDDYVETTGRVFGSKCYLYQDARSGVMNARIISMPVVRRLSSIDHNLLERGAFKKLPKQFMGGSNKNVREFLKAAYEGDGSFSRGTVSIICENMDFAEQVQTLLLRFGIRSHILKDCNVYRVTINGEANLKTFYEDVGFVSSEKNSKLLDYLKKEKSYRTVTDVIPNSGRKVEELLKRLKIHQSKITKSQSLQQQFSNRYNFTRRTFEALVNAMEGKLSIVREGMRLAERARSMRELVEIRKRLNFSQYDLARGDDGVRHLISYYELNGRNVEWHRKLLLECCREKLGAEKEVATLRRLLESEIRWCRVVSSQMVENDDSEWVYDVGAGPTKAFVSECAILHNSISVAKAGIVARFRAKTSILAAANPKYGRFDPTTNPSEQFAIPSTILSRFDLIFPIKDIMDVEKDKKLADHILAQHFAAGKKIEMAENVDEVKPAIEVELLRKYIAYARKKILPVLTVEANEKIKEYYVDLRKQGIIQGAVPITPRYIEGLVRLAEASAKVRLSRRVEVVDAERAVKLLDFVLRSMAMDRGLGRVDIDIIATGQSTSKRDAIKVILDVVKELEGQFDFVEMERIIEEAKKYNVEEFNARKIMEELIRAGDLYKPKPGYVKTTPKKIE